MRKEISEDFRYCQSTKVNKMTQTIEARKSLDRIVAQVIEQSIIQPTHKVSGIKIYSMTQKAYVGIEMIPGVLQTVLARGQMVEPHSHSFEAWYFTDGVAQLFTATEPRIALPEYAAICVAPKTVHGWSDVYTGKDHGIISHFHVGHGVHNVKSVY